MKIAAAAGRRFAGHADRRPGGRASPSCSLTRDLAGGMHDSIDRCQPRRSSSRHCGQWPLIWLDCIGLANIQLISEIGRIFSLHPLALEDDGQHRPAAEGRSLRGPCLRRAVRMIDDVTLNRYEQIAVFFGKNFVVTFQERAGDPFNPVRKRIESSACPNRLRARKRRLSRLCADRCDRRQLLPAGRGDRRQ